MMNALLVAVLFVFFVGSMLLLVDDGGDGWIVAALFSALMMVWVCTRPLGMQ
jgi:hypothetical protein